MLSFPRLSPLALGAIAIAAPGCFDPIATNGNKGSGTGSETTDDGVSTTTTATTTESGSEGPADSTGVDDQPPEIVSFTLDGSADPPELESSGLIVLEVDVTDDVGIARVEFYEGEELLASVDSAPYQYEVLITSAENGSHSYSAVAVDTSEQTTESDPIILSVNITGGEPLQVRPSVGETSVTLVMMGSPRLALEGDSRVIIAAHSSTERDTPSLLINSYDPELSLLWAQNHPTPPGRLGKVHTSLHENSIVVGAIRTEDGLYQHNILRLTTTDGSLEDSTDIWTNPNGLTTWDHTVTFSTEGSIYTTVSDNETAKLSNDLSKEEWSSGELGQAIISLIATPDGGTLVSFQGEGCGTGENLCIRRLSTDGSTEWTRTVGQDISLGLALNSTRPAVSNTGRFALTYATDTADHLVVFDDQGNELTRTTLGDETRATEVAFTTVGTLVAVGRTDAGSPYDGSAIHYREDGTEIWRESYSMGAGDSAITGVVVDAQGRLYVSGFSDPFDETTFGFRAEAWLAELSL